MSKIKEFAYSRDPCWRKTGHETFVSLTRIHNIKPLGYVFIPRRSVMAPGTPGPLKTSIPSHSGVNFQYFSFLVFGWYLDRFCFHFGPSWHQVGTKFGQTSRMFRKKLKKKQQQQNIKKKASQKSWKYPQVSTSIPSKSSKPHEIPLKYHISHITYHIPHIIYHISHNM